MNLKNNFNSTIQATHEPINANMIYGSTNNRASSNEVAIVAIVIGVLILTAYILKCTRK